MNQHEKQNTQNDFTEDEQPWRPPAEPIEGQHEPLLSDTASEPSDQPETPQSCDPQEQDEQAQQDQPDDETEDAEGQTDDSPDEETDINTASIIEAILFASDEPVTPQKIVSMVGTGDVKQTRKHIGELNKKYKAMNCAFRIESIAGGYLMLTLPQYNTWLRKLLKVRSESKLSPAALETLAIIAYKQPILRVDIEAIRGVAAGEMIRQLIEKSLVKIVGRAEVIGRPLLYGTTKKFLEVFGLNTLKDLPTADELKKPNP